MIVYIEARSIKGTVEEAIKDNLGCKENDTADLMTHIENGEGVAIVIDAIDEIRNASVMKNVKEYIRNRRESQEGPQLFISSRTDQCPIKSINFDRFAVLEGFSVKQGLDYVDKYFDSKHPMREKVMEYITRHKCRLGGVLSNPLKLHVFCALTSEGILKLTENSEFDVVDLFTKLETFLIKRECQKRGVEKPTESQKRCFHRMCLYSILSGLRKFPESQLDQWGVPKCYLVFLEAQIQRDKNGHSVTYYRFRHEVVYEYFASCYINSLPLESLVPLLLSVSSNSSLRNVQRIMFNMLTKRTSHREELLCTLIFGILLFQNEKMRSEQGIPDDILNLWNNINIKAEVPLEEIVSIHDDQCAERIAKINNIWKKIEQEMAGHTKVMSTLGWFKNIEANGTVKHVLDCILKYCSPKQQEEIIPKTLHQLLPCEFQEEE